MFPHPSTLGFIVFYILDQTSHLSSTMFPRAPHRPRIPQFVPKHLTVCMSLFLPRPNTHVLSTKPISQVSGSSVFTGSSPSTPRSIIINFLQVVHYRRPVYLRSKELQQAVRDEILSWGLDIPKWDTIIPPSCAMAEMSYSDHSFEQKLLISVCHFHILCTFDLTRPTALHLVHDLHG